VSLAISAIIIWGTWDLFREAINMALAVPVGIDLSAVKRYLGGLAGVTAVHDLHVWSMSTTETALTVHLVKPDAKIDDQILARICNELHERFGIDHSTIQLEKGEALCRQESHQSV
jgi:cobalt-zinc-cadmium efflux system protein